MMIYYRSDHYNFAKHGIPAVFFFNGLHADYHKETDTVDKIDFKSLQKRTQLIFGLAWELANRQERIKVDRDGK
ncbi:putative leucine aminopeptidase (fragment) [Capnocytophaga canimorsus]|uniref:Putative leucine aminopeptidase n=2 Tax=Capnocytophaga canimorsus TaxID=28188 RepID=A0A0B7H267_9FLAO